MFLQGITSVQAWASPEAGTALLRHSIVTVGAQTRGFLINFAIRSGRVILVFHANRMFYCLFCSPAIKSSAVSTLEIAAEAILIKSIRFS